MKCSSYAYLNNTDFNGNNNCSSGNFHKSLIVPCTDGYIFDGVEKTIVNEVGICILDIYWRIFDILNYR